MKPNATVPSKINILRSIEQGVREDMQDLYEQGEDAYKERLEE